MFYGRTSEILWISHYTSLNLAKCRGTKRMPRVCKATWDVVEVVEPPWVAWTLCKFVENFSYQWM
jgi:hypothetical protein